MSYYRGTAVTAALQARLELILPENGYKTRIGRKVYMDSPRGTPTDLPCIYLLPGAELGAKQYGVGQRERTYSVNCLVNRRETTIEGYVADPAAEWVIVEALIADLCQAIEAPGAFSSSLVEHVNYEGSNPHYHQEGGELTGITSKYSIRFAIAKGDPDNSPT